MDEFFFLFTHSWSSAQPVMIQQVFFPSDISVSTPTLLLLLSQHFTCSKNSVSAICRDTDSCSLDSAVIHIANKLK